MESIKDKVAVIGMGCSKFGERWDKNADDLIIEAAYEAYEDAGIGPNDIQAAWVGTARSGERGSCLAGPLKLRNLPITRVENACCTGHDAIRNAAFGVACGMYDIVLAVGVEKLKDTGTGGQGVGRGLHPVMEYQRTAPGSFAFIANRYFHTYGISPEDGKTTISKIAVKNHHNGCLHPKAHLRFEITLDQAMHAPMIAYPLGLYDCCGVADGAAAAIICRADMAKKFRPDPIYLKGVGLAANQMLPHFEPGFNWTGFEMNRSAARQAYEQAGIVNPRKQIDLACVHDCFTITELILYEDLGFSPIGSAKEDVDAGTFTIEGELPVNTDGGLKSFGHPVGASGIRMAYEVYKQLQHKCAERQVKDANIGLCHTLGGPPEVSCVMIFGNRLG